MNSNATANGNLQNLQRYKDYNSPHKIDNLTYWYATGTNKLQSISDAVSSTSIDWDMEDSDFTYNDNGQLTSSTRAPDVDNISYGDGGLAYRMDLAVDNDPHVGDGSSLHFKYNAAGQRIQKQLMEDYYGVPQLAEEENFIMDGTRLIAVTDASGAVKFWNLYGAGLLGRTMSDGTNQFYITDHRGSVRVVWSFTDGVQEYYDYYPFGLQMRAQVSGTPVNETFTGKEQDEETGYYYFGARYYHAGLGNWGAPDPAGQYASPFVYAGNSPYMYTDPDGKFAVELLAITSIAAGIYGSYKAYDATGNWTDAISGFTQTAVIGGFTAGAGSVGGTVMGSAALEAATATSFAAMQGEDTKSLVGGGVASFVTALTPVHMPTTGSKLANAAIEIAYEGAKGGLRDAISNIFQPNDSEIWGGTRFGLIAGAVKVIGAYGPIVRNSEVDNSPESQTEFNLAENRTGINLKTKYTDNLYDPVFRDGDLSILGAIFGVGSGLTLGNNMMLYGDYSAAAHEALHHRLHYSLRGNNWYLNYLYQAIIKGQGFGASNVWEPPIYDILTP